MKTQLSPLVERLTDTSKGWNCIINQCSLLGMGQLIFILFLILSEHSLHETLRRC